MERIFSSFSLIILGFSELYLAIAEILIIKVTKTIYKIITPVIYVGVLAVLLSFMIGLSTFTNIPVTTKVPAPTVSSLNKNLNKELTVAINDSLNIKYTKYIHTYMVRSSTQPSRGGSSRFDESKIMQLNESSATTSQAIDNTQVVPESQVEVQPKPDVNQYINWTKDIGDNLIRTEFGSLVRCNLPSDYGSRIDYSSFKPYESYRAITARGSTAYKVTHSSDAYNDDNGFRRYYTQGRSEFTVNNHMGENGTLYGDDDYIVALGSYYTGNNVRVGERFLIVGENGMYTVRIGDQKADRHTDRKHMYSTHYWCGTKYAGLIEFIVNTSGLESSVKSDGTVDSSSVKALNGKIKAIYRIDS